jgi:hypothetical protein
VASTSLTPIVAPSKPASDLFDNLAKLTNNDPRLVTALLNRMGYKQAQIDVVLNAMPALKQKPAADPAIAKKPVVKKAPSVKPSQTNGNVPPLIDLTKPESNEVISNPSPIPTLTPQKRKRVSKAAAKYSPVVGKKPSG